MTIRVLPANPSIEDRQQVREGLQDGDVVYAQGENMFLRYHAEDDALDWVPLDDPAEPQLRDALDFQSQTAEDGPAHDRSTPQRQHRLALETVGSGKPEDAAWFLKNTGMYDVRQGPEGEYFYRLRDSDEWGVIDPKGWQGWEEFGMDLAHYVGKLLTTGAAASKGAAVGFAKGMIGGPMAWLTAPLGTMAGGAVGAGFGEVLRQEVGTAMGVNPPGKIHADDAPIDSVGGLLGDAAGGMVNDEVGYEAAWGAVPFDLAMKGAGRALFPKGRVKEAVRQGSRPGVDRQPLLNSGRKAPVDVASPADQANRIQSTILNRGVQGARQNVDALNTSANTTLRDADRAATYRALQQREAIHPPTAGRFVDDLPRPEAVSRLTPEDVARNTGPLSPEERDLMNILDLFVDESHLLPDARHLDRATATRKAAQVLDQGIDAATRGRVAQGRTGIASLMYREPSNVKGVVAKGTPYASRDLVEDYVPGAEGLTARTVDRLAEPVSIPGLYDSLLPRDARADAPPENFVMRRDPAVRPGSGPVPAEIDPYQAALDELAAGSQVGELPPLPEAQEGEDFFYNEDGELVINIRGGRGKPEKPKKKGVEALMSR